MLGSLRLIGKSGGMDSGPPWLIFGKVKTLIFPWIALLSHQFSLIWRTVSLVQEDVASDNKFRTGGIFVPRLQVKKTFKFNIQLLALKNSLI